MFTGIIEARGTVKSVEKKGSSGRITVETASEPEYLKGVKPGDSISVDGVCLTMAFQPGVTAFTADISGETLRLTTLGELKPGDRVNLERSLLSKPLGGHFVTGHVDGTGTIKRKLFVGENVELEVSVPYELKKQIVRKGSVSIDGISLTVAELTESGFRAAIVPHTLKMTTLSVKKEGGRVNIETDIIGKYVERFLSGSKKEGVTEDFLIEHGFILKDKVK
jgi:riboflavin synthase